MPALKKARKVPKRAKRKPLVMVAGTSGEGSSYTVPGKGTTTRKPSGKADTFEGAGPAPSGTTKVPEKSYTEVPTVTVTSTPSGERRVSTSGFKQERAAKRAVRAQKARAQRVKRIVRDTKVKAQKRSQRAERIKPPTTYEAPKPKAVDFKPPTFKPPKFEGKPTAGAPTLGELRTAKASDALKVNKAGSITTPKVRQVSREVKQARKAVAKTKPQIEGLLNEEQERFAERLSQKTGLPPKLAGDWTLKESGASSAGAGGEAGEQNQLGVGYPAHPTSFSRSGYFNNTTPEKAADATAAWMEGKIGADYDYQAAPSIQEIPKLAKSGASDAELRAYIAGPSAWGTGEIPDSPQVTATPGKAAPKAAKRLRKAETQARRVGLHPGRSAGDVAPGGAKTVKVRADAKGMVKWTESTLGTQEGTGKQLKWAGKFGLGSTEPWCANFVSNGLLRRGIRNLPSNPNYVPSFEGEWSKYAVPVSDMKPGDLVTFSGSHIGIYVGGGEMISGNSSDAVSRTSVGSPSMVIRPPYKGGWIKVKESTVLPGSTSPTAAPSSSGAPASVGLVASPSQGTTGGKRAEAKEQRPKLSPLQKAARTNKQLMELGVAPVGSESKAPATSDKVLTSLAKKYGVAV